MFPSYKCLCFLRPSFNLLQQMLHDARNILMLHTLKLSVRYHYHLIFFTKTCTGCDVPLGMESGEISDCQLSSSPATSARHTISSARPGVPSFWSPAVDLDVADHWIQVNFNRVTHLQRITFHTIRDQGSLIQAWMEVSRNGNDWTPVVVNRVTAATSSGDKGKHVSASLV